MKKIILSFVVVSIIVFFALSNLSFGASKAIKVVVGGETLTMDSAPVVENGRTLAPMRAIFESLDAYIDWDSKTKTITAYKGKKVVKIKIGSKTASIDGKSVDLDLPAKIYDSRTLVPLRFVGEALGAQVDWDSDQRIIKVTAEDEPSGNSTGNISNFGFAAEYGDWIYTTVLGKGFYRIDKAGEQKEKISSNSILNVNVIDDWIYFSNPVDYPVEDEIGRLYKMKTKGNLLTKLTKYQVDCVSVVGDWIYYLNVDDDDKIYKMRIDGKGEEKIYDDSSVSGFVVKNGWIYFKEEDDDSLFKIRTNGNDKKLLCKGIGEDSGIVADGNWLYYASEGKEAGINKISLDGKEQSQIVFGDVDSFNVNNGYLYYNDLSKNLYKIKIDGGGKVKIGSGVEGAIDVADSWIYYKSWSSKSDNAKDYRIKDDSTKKQRLVMDGPFVDIAMYSLSNDKPSPNPIIIPPHEASSAILSAKEVARQKDAVAFIKTFDEEGNPIASGSGFNIDSSGIVVTNFHVIKGASSIKCTLSNNLTFDVSHVLNYNPVRDIAILKLSNASNLPVVYMGASGGVELAESVVAIGNPMELQNTVSTGVISGVRTLDGIEYIQTTASISPGSSGGPLFNMHGEVVGMTTLMLSGTQNINFAVPIDAVKKLLGSAVLIPVQGITDLDKTVFENEPNDSIDKAAEVNLEQYIKGSIKDKNDKDYYSLTLNKSCKISITGISEANEDNTKYISLTIVDKNGNELAKSQSVKETERDLQNIKASLNEGTYYLVVKSAESSSEKTKNIDYEISITEE